MACEVVHVSGATPEPDVIARAVAVLAQGGIVALPTETVYGLAARVDLPSAMDRLRTLKNRPDGEPFPVQVPDMQAARELVGEFPHAALPLMVHFWPGPLTIVFPDARLNAGGKGLGLRVPAHPVPLAVLRGAGGALAVPSANPRGAPPPVEAGAVAAYFPEDVDLVLDAGPTQIKESSTVVRLMDKGWELLREGLISAEMIGRLIDPRMVLFVCMGNTCRSPMAAALAARVLEDHLGISPQALGIRVLSAGTDSRSGARASRLAREAAGELGLALEGHRARRLTSAIIRGAALVLCMSRREVARVLELAPDARQKTVLLDAPEEIPDPMGEGIDAYRRALEAIRRALDERWKPRGRLSLRPRAST